MDGVLGVVLIFQDVVGDNKHIVPILEIEPFKFASVLRIVNQLEIDQHGRTRPCSFILQGRYGKPVYGNSRDHHTVFG